MSVLDTATATALQLDRNVDMLRFATAGSVDDGKSTLVGRLLHDSKSVSTDTLEAVERASRDRGADGVELALLTDGLRAEREQGITIDVAYRYFTTTRRKFVLADTPGHVQYTRNMVTGASTAELVVILVDARKGVVEQTRRHLAVAALANSAAITVKVDSSKSTRSILFTARTRCRTPSSAATARWRRVCSTTPLRASTKMTTNSAVDAPVTMLRVYCTCPGVSASTNLRRVVVK